MGNRKRVRKESKFVRYMSRILALARDLYIKSLTGGGEHVSYGNTMGCPTPRIPNLPKSFSTNSTNYRTSEEQLKEMIRFANSTRGQNGQIEPELFRSKTAPSLRGGGAAASVNRSDKAVFGRIDEDEAFDEFGGGDDVVLLRRREIIGPRSRSYAITAKRSTMA